MALAKIGDTRDAVERRVGPPMHPGRDSRAVYPTTPMLVLTYTSDDAVEVVEIACSGDGDEEVCYDGVQLTYRFIEDVVADLVAKGLRGEPTDVGYRFEAGFALFSTGSRWARDLDPAASEEDERRVCEGVSVAPYDYFRKPTAAEIEAYIRAQEARRREVEA